VRAVVAETVERGGHLTVGGAKGGDSRCGLRHVAPALLPLRFEVDAVAGVATDPASTSATPTATSRGAPRRARPIHTLDSKEARRESWRGGDNPTSERAALWPRAVAVYKGYGNYQTKTDREIPLVILEPPSA